MLPASRKRRGPRDVTSRRRRLCAISRRSREPLFPLSGHEQAEPGVLCAARRAGLPGPLQGTGRLQGRAHRRDQGEPEPGAARKRGQARHFPLQLSLRVQVLTGHSSHPCPSPQSEWASDPTLVKRLQPPMPRNLFVVFRVPAPFSKMT